MNFLAHLFLAGPPAAPDYPGLVVGQFIADAVPGRQLENYPPAVQAGIRLHRAIDTFTDQHPVVRRSTRRLRTAGYGKYAGVVSDIFLDHFLAHNFSEYSPEPLPAFTQRVYALLQTQKGMMPERAQRTLHYMTLHDWLSGYALLAGIGRALNGLSQRAMPGSGMETAGEELERNYAAYGADFREFFPELQKLVATSLSS
jgi:acyl carrier protein phosphodiesterase